MSSKIRRRAFSVILLVGLILGLTASPSVGAPAVARLQPEPATGAVSVLSDDPNGVGAEDDAAQSAPASPKVSHRLIVQLTSPPLAEAFVATSASRPQPQSGRVRLDVNAPESQNYVAQIEAEQAAFVNAMRSALPTASVATYINENGQTEQATYQVVFNGLSVDPGAIGTAEAMRVLRKMPGVKAVYPDRAHDPAMYASLPLINAAAAWNNAAIGGQADAGRGIKVASMDGGVHHDAPMFSGAGFSYPPGYPPNGLGLTANNNGKIIASRAYFRSWDPPAPGDENPWPGENGTPHGTHTSSTAAGNQVVASYLGITETLSGVAPAAWVMSYRVFYASVNGNESFYDTEGVAALEDITIDGPDVLNNSWGEGPTAAGGLDPIDQALINAANSGIFISMSTGNAGPGNGTTDHPSSEYINVAASTTSGTYASGRVSVSAPQPISPTLQNKSFGSGLFGAPLPVGTVFTRTFVASAVISPTNVNGCNPWPAGTFTGQAAVIQRGVCEFGVKVLNAEQAGATFVVIYNSAAGGEAILNMSPGAVGNQVTISSIFVQRSMGLGMVSWYTTNGAASELTVDTIAFQVSNTPDRIIGFSSRGPGVGNVLKPDIAAPGVNILAQGFAPGAIGEARHLGFGQVSGTSMAAPHVAGAAALLRQIHPTWSNSYIKSALMSTSKYLDIYNFDETPAQPLDMGAGRLDLTRAADPGIILSPPSLSFGPVLTGTSRSIQVTATSVATATETYSLTTLYTGGGFTQTLLVPLPGFSVSPSAITLAPGTSAVFTVTFNSATSSGLGDNQGYAILDGPNHDGHMPAWARVTYTAGADVLIIDNDGSSSLGFDDYLGYYASTLTALGLTYDVLDVDASAGAASTFLNTVDLLAYNMIVYFTGDNFFPDGTFTVPTPLTAIDMDRLTEYANNGGVLLAMGQDMASVLNSLTSSTASFFYSNVLGGSFLQDSVSNNANPTLPVVPVDAAPDEFAGLSLDLSAPRTYTASVTLLGSNEVSPITTTTTGRGSFTYDVASRKLDYTVRITSPVPITLTAAHIHSGTVGVNGPVLYTLLSTVVTNTTDYTFSGAVIVSSAHVNRLLTGGLYVNAHTDVNPGGEVRDQLLPVPTTDGAGNQVFIDEIEPHPPLIDFGDPNMPEELEYYAPLLKYPGPFNLEDGVVAVAHRAQPTLERPGIPYVGRSIYTTFGLEGVNGAASRANLLATFGAWALDEPTVVISNTTATNNSQLTTFNASFASNVGATGVTYRWDFGDGSPYAGPYTTTQASHEYFCGTYTVRVEVTDSFGNRAIGSQQISVTQNCVARVFLPIVLK